MNKNNDLTADMIIITFSGSIGSDKITFLNESIDGLKKSNINTKVCLQNNSDHTIASRITFKRQSHYCVKPSNYTILEPRETKTWDVTFETENFRKLAESQDQKACIEFLKFDELILSGKDECQERKSSQDIIKLKISLCTANNVSSTESSSSADSILSKPNGNIKIYKNFSINDIRTAWEKSRKDRMIVKKVECAFIDTLKDINSNKIHKSTSNSHDESLTAINCKLCSDKKILPMQSLPVDTLMKTVVTAELMKTNRKGYSGNVYQSNVGLKEEMGEEKPSFKTHDTTEKTSCSKEKDEIIPDSCNTLPMRSANPDQAIKRLKYCNIRYDPDSGHEESNYENRTLKRSQRKKVRKSYVQEISEKNQDKIRLANTDKFQKNWSWYFYLSNFIVCVLMAIFKVLILDLIEQNKLEV